MVDESWPISSVVSSAGMSSPPASSSSSMDRPSLIRRWMRLAKVVGSSKEKPLVSNDVS